MRKDELDAKIKKVLEQRTEGIETSPMMLERIKGAVASKERKERISMRLFTAKKIAVIAVLCFASVTCYAAAQLGGVEAKVGFDMKTVESFSNGFVFRNGGTGEVKGQDENGNPIGKTYQMMSMMYEKGDKTLMVIAENGNPSADAGEEVREGYSTQLYKFVPEDYELTAEDQEREANGEIIISYGTDEVVENIMEVYSWKDGDLFYSMTAEDCNLGEVTMAQMAQELKNS